MIEISYSSDSPPSSFLFESNNFEIEFETNNFVQQKVEWHRTDMCHMYNEINKKLSTTNLIAYLLLSTNKYWSSDK